jgi:hypothetical protein
MELNNLAKKRFSNQMGYLMNQLISESKSFLQYEQFKEENNSFFILKENMDTQKLNLSECKHFEYIDISKTSIGLRKFIRNYLIVSEPQIEKSNSILGPEINFIIHLGKHVNIRRWIKKFTSVELPKTLQPSEPDGKLLLTSQPPSEILLDDEQVIGLKLQTQHIIIVCDEQSFSFGQQIKFAHGLSENFFFHCSLDEVDSFKLCGFNAIQSLFITNIYRNLEKKNINQPLNKINIHTEIYYDGKIIFLNEVRNDCLKFLEKRFKEAWNNSLEYLSITEENVSFSRDEIFSIKFRFYGDYKKKNSQSFNFDAENLETNYPYRSLSPEKNYKFFPSLNYENYQELIMHAWIKSQTVDFIPLGKKEIPVSYWTKKLCSRYLIQNFFDKIVFNSMVNLLKKWYAMTEKGIYIKNINQNLMLLIKNIQTQVLELGKKLKHLDFIKQYDVSIGQYFSKKEIFLINYYSKKAWSFFERHLKKIWFFQIRMLQYKCSVIFKEKILKLFLQEPLHWDAGSTEAIKECEELFMKSGADFEIPLIKKTLYFAKSELKNALKDYFIELKESPAKELNALDKIEKSVNRTKSKSKQMIVGFALTTAVRLPGYGNFQLVSSYAHGPHVFNFSCINDKSTLENETKGYVKPLRIQPSLNFDIRL